MQLKKGLRIWLSMIGFLLTVAGAQAGGLKGVIKDGYGTPLAGAKLVVLDETGTEVSSAISSENGTYTLEVAAGNYWAVASKRGYVSRRFWVEVYSDGEREQDFTLPVYREAQGQNRITIRADGGAAEAEYLVENQGSLIDPNGLWRFANRNAYWTYGFTVGAAQWAKVKLTIGNQYLVLVNTDLHNSEGWKVLTSSWTKGSATTLEFDLTPYLSGPDLYLRFGDADPTDGYGAYLPSMELIYSSQATKGNLSGVIKSTAGNPISGAEIVCAGAVTTSNAEGKYFLADIPEGEQVVTVSKGGYQQESKLALVTGGEETSLDFTLALPRQVLTGTVFDPTGEGIADVWVGVAGTGYVTSSRTDGTYDLAGLEPGNYEIVAWKKGWRPARQSVVITLEGAKIDFTLSAAGSAAVEQPQLTITPQIGFLKLNWQNQEGEMYNLYRSREAERQDREKPVVFALNGGQWLERGLQDGVIYRYWLEAVASDGSSAFSDPFTGQVLPPPVPCPITPLTNEVVVDQDFLFTWAGTTGAVGYTIEYSRDPSFSKIPLISRYLEIGTGETGERLTVSPTSSLADGLWYWRVRAHYPEGVTSEFSTSQSFRIVNTGDPAKTLTIPGIEANPQRVGPADSRVSITFVLNETATVEVKIYDLGGRVIAVPLKPKILSSHEFGFGIPHTVEWELEPRLRNGLYFCLVSARPLSGQSPPVKMVKRIVVVR